MKKFMMIILAIALVASYASAVSIDVTGSTAAAGKVNKGDTLTVKWTDTTEIFGGFSSMVLNVSQGTFGSFTFAPITWILSNSMTAVNGAGFDVTVDASGFPIPANTGTLFTLVFQVPQTAVGKVNLAVTGGSFNTNGFDEIFAGAGSPTASLDVVVPEPVTLVLLGLGGLFLRRRK